DDWMADRWTEVRRATQAYQDGQRRWATSTANEQNLRAHRPSDVVALGLSAASPSRRPAPAPALRPEMQELRRQQAAFHEIRRKLDIGNSWMAGLALAPIAAVGGLEALPFAIAREIVPDGLPLVFPGREPRRRGGDTHEARLGREAHAKFKRQVAAKPGWRPDPRLGEPGQPTKIPDAQL